MLASISTEVRVHSWPDGNLINVYKPATHLFNGDIKTISWAKGGGWLILVPNIGSAEIVSFNENVKLLHSIVGIQNPTCASFPNTTKRNIALGIDKGKIVIYDVKTKTVKKEYPSAPSSFFKVEYSYKDTHIIAGCLNDEIFIYNNANSSFASSYRIPNAGRLINIRSHPSKKFIGGCSEIGVVTVWDMFSSKFITNTQLHNGDVADMAFSKTRPENFVTIGSDRRICCYDMNSNSIVDDMTVHSDPSAVDFSYDGFGIAVGFKDGRVCAYDTRFFKEHLSNIPKHKTRINQISFEKNIDRYSSNINLSEEQADCYIENDDYYKSSQSPSNCRMFSGDYLPDIPEVDNEFSSNESMQDYFTQDARYCSKINHPVSLGITDGVKKLMDSKPNLLGNCPESFFTSDKIMMKNCVDNSMQCELISPSNILENQLAEAAAIARNKDDQKSKQLEAELSQFMKDIKKTITEELSKNKTNIDETMKTFIKDTIKEQLDEFGKNNMYYQFVEVMSSVRRHFLDLQMFLVKEFIRTEEYMQKLKDEVTNYDGGYMNESAIIQENMKLRDEICYLKEKISND